MLPKFCGGPKRPCVVERRGGAGAAEQDQLALRRIVGKLVVGIARPRTVRKIHAGPGRSAPHPCVVDVVGALRVLFPTEQDHLAQRWIVRHGPTVACGRRVRRVLLSPVEPIPRPRVVLIVAVFVRSSEQNDIAGRRIVGHGSALTPAGGAVRRACWGHVRPGRAVPDPRVILHHATAIQSAEQRHVVGRWVEYHAGAGTPAGGAVRRV